MSVRIGLPQPIFCGLIEELGCPRLPVTEKTTGSNPVRSANFCVPTIAYPGRHVYGLLGAQEMHNTQTMLQQCRKAPGRPRVAVSLAGQGT